MATGEIQPCLVKGSDEFSQFMCSPCSRKGLDVGAVVYCVQCEEYLCSKCHGNHNSFAKMATHTMLDKVQMETKGPQPVQPLLMVPCDLHPGQVYTLFCEKHDQVCCAVCFPVGHRSCDVKYILGVAKRATQGSELNEFTHAIKELRKRLDNVKNERNADLHRLTAEKDTELDKIQNTVKQMMTELDAIEKSAINEITRKYTEFKTNIENDLNELDQAVEALTTKLDKLETAKDDTEKFIHMKTCKENKSKANTLIVDIQAHVGEEKLEFQIDTRAEQSIKKLRSLGQLVLDYQYAITPEGHPRVDTKKDKKVCFVSDLCLLDDGTMLVAGWNNRCLKRLDQSHNVIDRLALGDIPWGVGSLSTKEAAITMCESKKVQTVTLEGTMSASGSFKTTDRCRSIVCYSDHLYISCGGGQGAGPGHMAVHSILGTLVQKFENDRQGKLFTSVPLGLAISSKDGVILVCDRGHGLVALRQDGQRLWALSCKDLDVASVTRVCTDSVGQALVSSVVSNKVVLVSKAGKKLSEMLTEQDGITKPKALCFDKQRSRLTIGMEDDNQINIFKLALK